MDNQVKQFVLRTKSLKSKEFRIKRAILIFICFFIPVFFLSADQNDEIRKAIVTAAKKYLGTPYVYGGLSTSGFDCSGFICYVYESAANMKIPRTSKSIWNNGTPVRIAAAKPGDIIVFDTVGGTPSHVAILLDDSSMIHAVSAGTRTGVIISPLQDRYFAPRIIGVRSFFPVSQNNSETRRNPEVQVKPEIPVEPLGFTITNEPVIYNDKIPAVTGSGIQFAITNGTGADGTFEILFYKMDPSFSNIKTLYQTRVKIGAGKMVETAPFIFTEPGQYKLILKTQSNLKRVERIWQVVEQK